MKTSEVLFKTIDVIEDRGWTKGEWGKPGDKVCIEGGIAAAMGLDLYPNGAFDEPLYKEFRSCPAYKAVTDHLNHDRFDPLFRWNDRAARTQEEVVALLREVAEIEQEKEN